MASAVLGAPLSAASFTKDTVVILLMALLPEAQLELTGPCAPAWPGSLLLPLVTEPTPTPAQKAFIYAPRPIAGGVGM